MYRDRGRRTFLKSAAAGVAAAAFPALSRAQTGSRPNIVLIYTDDQPLAEYNCYGGHVVSPHVDRLARTGMRFNRFYISSAVCSPSRYSTLTGRYASRSQSILRKFPPGTHMNMGWEPQLLGDIEAGHRDALPQVLRRHGYATGMVGKWHQGDEAGKIPEGTDWQSPAGQAVARAHYAKVVHSVKRCGFDYADGVYKANVLGFMPARFAVHNQEWMTAAALAFLDQHAEQPFFLYMATTLTHGPSPIRQGLRADPHITPAGRLETLPSVQPTRESVLTRCQEAGLPERLAGVTWLDDAVGAVLDRLDALEVADNTIVIVASDNGKRGKFSCYDAGARMPMLIRWPARVTPGSVCDQLVSNVDLAPTIYDLAGLPVPSDNVVDGTSFAPLLTGRGVYARPSLYLEIGSTRAVVSDDFHKYIAVRFAPDIEEKARRGERHTHWALPMSDAHHTYNNEKHYPGYFDADQLYNLKTDPDEQRNLASEPDQTERLAAMKEQLAEYVRPLPHAFGEFGAGNP